MVDSESMLELRLLAKDRDRIARELHDGVIQSMYGVGLVLEGLKGEADLGRIHDQLSSITASINVVIDDVRAYINDLTPTRLVKRGFGRELCALAKEFQASSSVPAAVRLQESVDQITPELGRDLIQIARESLSNVSRHAAASRVTLSLRWTTDTVCLEIVDDGRGFQPSLGQPGQGLGNIVHPAQLLGGTAEITSRSGAGTAVRVNVPRLVSTASVA